MDYNFSFTVDKSSINMEYFETEQEFIRKFGHGIPTEMIPDRITKDEIIAAMKQCLEEDEDRLLEILNVKVNYNWVY